MMFSLVFGAILGVLALIALFVPVPEQVRGVKRIGSLGVLGFGAFIALFGGVAYNDAGYCTHNRDAFGTESVICDVGWYFSGWGSGTQWPHFITVSHTLDSTEGSVSDLPPYVIRMADNWAGKVTQATRFAIPQDDEQFLAMAHSFRTPERLVVTTLRPAVTSSLDSIANLYSMEEYWSGGKRDEFKTEYENAVKYGRPAVDRKEILVKGIDDPETVAPSDSENAQDTSNTGSPDSIRYVTVKRLDASGNEIRDAHEYSQYGITVSSAIVEQIDPDDKFEDRISERKEAASRRIIARERRLEEEEQRLLAIAKGDREIAERQAQAKVKQIEETTNAQTSKQLALIAAEKQREEARIAQQTAEIGLKTAEIDANKVKVTADADSYARKALLEADNALKLRLDNDLAIQTVWADAYAKRNVPHIVLGDEGGAGSTSGTDEVKQFMQMLTIDAAKRLADEQPVK